MRRPGLLLLAMLLLAAGALFALFAQRDGGMSMEGYYAQRVEWRSCNDVFECGTLQVPLDYRQPEAKSISLALVRHVAARPAQRVGSLVVNPGGPGASGTDYVQGYDSQFSQTVVDRFDIVGFDPRGVNRSTAVRCVDGPTLDELLASEPTPDDAAEVAQSDQISRDFAADCLANAGAELLNHVSTMETVRDLDIIRAALGEAKLNFLGKSYGTVIGAEYAHEFPDRVGRLVLDGAVDVSLSSSELAKQQAASFDQEIRRFAQYCVQTNDTCPLGVDEAAIVARLRAFLDGLDARPLASGDASRPLTESLGWTAVIGPMYLPEGGWDWLIDSLKMAYNGDGSELLNIADWFNSRNSDGTYADNSTEANISINCVDYGPEQVDHDQLVKQFEQVAPIVGRLFAWGEGYCVDWPGKGELLNRDVSAPTAPQILVIGTRYDPATPAAWAKALAAQLGVGVFIEYDGDGHTAYVSGSFTIDKAVDDFLVAGKVPAAGTVYEPNSRLIK